ncbi:MAG TPA: hypothetical protein VGC77_13080 [Rhodopseudomonas sp.]|uniref:hypothetical protein n=1 Tax=Rhodopseudomonas sp. TaxID=1078 RepID=UPI002EDA3E55
MTTARRQRQRGGDGTRRTNVRPAGRGLPRALAVETAAALRHASRLALIWFTAFALIFQTTLALAAPVAAAQPDALALSALCESGLAHAPAGPGDHGVAPHIKCIACVIGHSLAPPAPLPALGPLPSLVDASPAWRLSAAVPRAAPAASHSARGPPAAA